MKRIAVPIPIVNYKGYAHSPPNGAGTKLSLGTARKVALLTIALSAVGWCLFVVGFGIYGNRYAYDGTITNYPELCWAWVASFIGPVVYILAWTHAVMWKKVTAVIESATILLGMVYTTTLGYALVTCGVYTYEFVTFTSSEPFAEYNNYPDYVGLMLAGSFIACLFWAITLALWPWYKDVEETFMFSTGTCKSTI